jgi:hypothetical protein
MKKEEHYQVHLSKAERKGKTQEEINRIRLQKFSESKEKTE